MPNCHLSTFLYISKGMVEEEGYVLVICEVPTLSVVERVMQQTRPVSRGLFIWSRQTYLSHRKMGLVFNG